MSIPKTQWRVLLKGYISIKGSKSRGILFRPVRLWSSVKAIVSEDPGPHARVSPKQSPHLTKNATELNSLRKPGG